MSPATVLRAVTGALEQSSIPYMITGSFASNFHGRVRSTADIDLVIAANPDQLKTLMKRLGEHGYYAQVEDALDAWRHNSMFNVIDDSMAWKIDFIMQKQEPFNREAFRRRIPGELDGIQVVVSTPEDLIIAKLDWAKQGESQRQIDDVAGILKVKAGLLDRDYIAKWVTDLELTAQWNAAKQAAGLE